MYNSDTKNASPYWGGTKMRVPDDVAELLSRIYQKKVVLFSGSGASVDAGGPKTKALVAAIKSAFPDAIYRDNDFIHTCTDVLETSRTSRRELEEVVRKQLFDLKPSSFHTELPLHIWRAVFTTNYDDLIEQGYRAVKDRVQNLDAIFGDRGLVTAGDTENLKLFKLMGCIVSQHPDAGLVLTQADYNIVVRRHPSVFRLLSDLMQDGTVLYVGYSFQDSLLIDIIEDLHSQMKDAFPYSYGLFPELDLQSIQASKLRERRITPLKRTAKELADILRHGVQPKLVPVAEKPGVTVMIKGQSKVIPHQEMRMYLRAFDFLFEEKLAELQEDNTERIRDFFRGVSTDWTGFVRGWDFIRVEYDNIAERARAELENPDVTDNRSILLLGPAGSGKTWMLRRLALDAYKIWGSPVIILRPYYEDIDFKLLASLCEELSYLEKVRRGKTSGVRSRILIIIENASSHVTDFKTISTFMKSRGIPVLVLGSTRENEWQIACESLGEQATYHDSYTVSDNFESGEERKQFVDHLSRLGVVEGSPSQAEMSNLIEKDYQNSFFSSVYSLIEPAQPLLENKITQEYNNLPPLARDAYLFVASFYQYGLPMPIALLVRALECSYTQFIEQIFESEAKRVICSIEAPLEGSYLGTRARLIAEKLIEKEVPNLDQLTEVIKRILSHLNPRNVDETQICRMLLIRHLGPNGTDRRFSVEQIRDLFTTAVDQGKLEDAAVLHHFGLFESDHGRQDDAMALVGRALKVLENQPVSVFMKSERIENIYNTLGLIQMRKAEEAESRSDAASAESLYAAATDYFSKAKGGELQTPHPYHCESRMYYYRAQRGTDPSSKVILLSTALEVIHDAEDNLPAESLPRLLELRALIREALFKVPDLDQVVKELEQTPGSELSGSLVKAKLTMLNADSPRQDRERALTILKDRVPGNTNNAELLRTYYRLYKNLYPGDLTGLYEVLNMRYDIPSERRNFSLLYELGVLSFSFEQYQKSTDCFKTLEKLSQGHPKRFGIYDRGVDENGTIRRFRGTVIRIESRSMGQVDLPELRRRVPFIPFAQRFTPQLGDNVTYEIGFNYRGWLAVDLLR
jgi:tetratricopeptide (TPR) repeat protein